MAIQYTQFENALTSIQAAFDTRESSIYRLRELTRFLAENRIAWNVPPSMANSELIRLLLQNTPLRKIRFSPVNHPPVNAEIRYVWRITDPFALALALKNDSYLSHASAMFLHGLVEKIPPQIFVNKEQSVKPPPSGTLDQAGINRAFAAKQRVSQFVFRFEDDRELVLLSGKNSNRLGVGPLRTAAGLTVEATTIERTLIDVVVRSAYAGGVEQVLHAYQAARDRISVKNLINLLKGMAYVYPYHQVIGFYMQRAGFPKSQCNQLKDLGLHFNFYLTYGMKKPVYLPEWRLYLPQGW